MFKIGMNFDPAQLEEAVLTFWEKERIFEQSLEKTKNGVPFTFYDGPPFATGLPHYGHILASTIKDLIPRYQTMRGRYVRRRWGWDCHGLPIEEIVERRLGISGKKQIEEIGIQKFNETCRSTVLQYAEEWGRMVRRIARWVEFDNSYKTMDRDYMESVWWAFKEIHSKGLVYEGRKVLMYCPRCETPISNFEVAMDNSYKEVTEEAVTVKFKVKGEENAYLLAWTTTPWTLPGNVALAVGAEIEYVKAKPAGDAAAYILAKDRLADVMPDAEIVSRMSGKELVGIAYEPLFDVPAVASDKAHKVYAADFVTTEDGTGIVHTAVVYGEEDYNLGIREGLPVVPLLDEKGKFNDKAPVLAQGMYFKDSEKFIKKDLEERGLMFARKMHQHSYPHCWRCGNILFYNALPAWFINVQKIKPALLVSNAEGANSTGEKTGIKWYPEHLKSGRYAKSVEAAPDWNISRNRYWGNPIPVWKCESCNDQTVVGSVKELGLGTNTFFFARHGESRTNTEKICVTYPEPGEYDLTEKGAAEAKKMAEDLRVAGGVDLIIASDLLRTRRTAEIVGQALGIKVETDPRLREYNVGVYNGQSYAKFEAEFPERERWSKAPEGGEALAEVRARMLDFVSEMSVKHSGKRILVVSHGHPLWMLQEHFGVRTGYPQFAEPFKVEASIADLHRPYIDNVTLPCKKCGGVQRRTSEIFDSWVEAGSMPFAEYHYPFENKELFQSRQPAQFVAEYIAQTRAWFYVMHVISEALFNKIPFENVATTGTILAEDGSKMSKSKNNFPDPWVTVEKYGVDALRFYLMNSVVMRADNLNFSLRDLENKYRKNVLIARNVHNYFLTYAAEARWRTGETSEPSLLDRWILARTKELVRDATLAFDSYDTVAGTEAIEKYMDDLSTWYLRRSRGREDKVFFATLYAAQITFTKVIAPVMPYLAEIIYKNLEEFGRNEADSVHLAAWPAQEDLSVEEAEIISGMQAVREAASIGLAARQTLKIPVRQPLGRMFATRKAAVFSKEMTDILLAELNVKRFDLALPAEEGIPAYAGMKHVENLYLDPALTEELKLEGLARNLERFVQEMRKKAGLQVGEMASLHYRTDDPHMERTLNSFDRKKTYISEVAARPDVSGEVFEWEGRKAEIAISRG